MSVRLFMTLQPQYNVELTPDPYMIKPSDMCCIIIWITTGLLSANLSLEIKRTGESVINLSQLRLTTFMMFVCVLSYEVLMFYFIYNLYAFVFNAVFQMLLILPHIALISHSFYQMFLIAYCEPLRPQDNESYKQLTVHIVTSILFNSIMIFHLFVMAVTCYSKLGIDIPALLLGHVELIYRIWVICRYIYLLTIHYLPYHLSHRPPTQCTTPSPTSYDEVAFATPRCPSVSFYFKEAGLSWPEPKSTHLIKGGIYVTGFIAMSYLVPHLGSLVTGMLDTNGNEL